MSFSAGVGKAKSMADGWETARRLDRPPVLEVRSPNQPQSSLLDLVLNLHQGNAYFRNLSGNVPEVVLPVFQIP